MPKLDLTILCCLAALVCGLQAQDIRNISVQTSRGVVVGRAISVQSPIEGQKVEIGEFLGINFAKAPTGEFRFAHPVYSEWDFDQFAHEFDKPCFQSGDGQMEESCIGANVWTPYNGDGPLGPTRHPVVVWFHGGRFESGSGSDERYVGRILTSHEKLVVASIQYRLGVLGFLRLDSKIAPGNMGLKDQALGLRFLHESIDRFGGNVSTITLMGLDAGAASIGYHILNAETRKFFSRAVMLGGSPMAWWAVRKDTKLIENLHIDFAVREVGCDPGNPDTPDINKLVTCLREQSPSFLIEKQKHFNRLFQGVEFPPVIDGDYIKEDPIEAFEAGKFDSVDLMIGVTDKEAAVYVERALEAQGIQKSQLADRAVYQQVLRNQFHFYKRQPDVLTETGRRVLVSELTDFGDPSAEGNYQTWMDASGDRIFVCPTNELADAFARKTGNSGQIYYYVFSEPDNEVHGYEGASHGSDAFYFMGGPSGDGRIAKPEQVLLSDRMMDYLKEFARTGDPVARDNEKAWARYNTNTYHYHNLTTKIAIDGSNPNRPHGFRRNPCGFWDKTLDYVNGLVENSSPIIIEKKVEGKKVYEDEAEKAVDCTGVMNDVSSAILGVLLTTLIITICLCIFMFLKLKKLKS